MTDPIFFLCNRIPHFVSYITEEGERFVAQSLENLKDEEIVQRALEGDKEAFGILFDRYYNLVYRLTLMKLGDKDMALDATQESFLKGYENLDRLREASSFASWMAGIARNLCRNILRNKGREPVSLDYLAEEGIEPPDSGHPPVFNPEQTDAVKKALLKIQVKYREALELRYAEEYSCGKIASFLNISLSAVKSRLFHARNLIKKHLKKEGLL
jgi:RNA polymerase sigma-70 factor (ECF subfamily)